jgi:hypothetical protein
MSDITTSSICSYFPLEHITSKFSKSSPAFNWINARSFIPGLSDMRARTGPFTTPWNATSHFLIPMPDLSMSEPRSLTELMDQRGQDIYINSKKINKKIMVMWSGGIDSTAVLVSMLKSIPPEEYRDRLVVCLSSDSILENFKFYKNIISNRIPIIHKTIVDVNQQFLEKYLLLTGELGDAVFGPAVGKYTHLVKEEKHLLPYKNNLQLLYSTLILFDEVHPECTGKWLVNKINENLEEVNPIQIVSVADWWWWVYVNFKWVNNIFVPFHSSDLRKNHRESISPMLTREFLDNTFFHTDYFHRWSYNNLHNFLPDKTITSHKKEIKQYIFDFDKNMEFLINKKKQVSIGFDLVDGMQRNKFTKPLYWDKNWIGYSWNDQDLDVNIEKMLHNYKG